MSAAALPIYNLLVARGVDEAEARTAAEAAVAEAVDARLSENLRAAKSHADEAVAKSEEKMAAEFVSRAHFHELDKQVATRADIADLRKEMRHEIAENRKEIAELRREMKFMNRIGIGLLVGIFILIAKLVVDF